MNGYEKEKEALRRRCRGLISAMTEAEKRAADAVICQKIGAFRAYLDASQVFFYAPTPNEPNILPLCAGKEVAFPLCQPDGQLRFCFSTVARLERGAYGILAPRADCPQAVADARTLCLVPGLAFTADGGRLGHGGGYYDRFLADFPGIAVGVCYGRQLVDALPRAAHDIGVWTVICEKEGTVYGTKGYAARV